MFAVTLLSDAETRGLGAVLAPHLRGGDCLLLKGPVGAGKSTLSRSVIQTRLGRAEDVPSPTFTLVQTYDVENEEIWHVDLYRLSTTDERYELGLIEAFEDQICLVEWADRLADLAPKAALSCEFLITPEDTRILHLEWSDPRWDTVIDAVKSSGVGRWQTQTK